MRPRVHRSRFLRWLLVDLLESLSVRTRSFRAAARPAAVSASRSLGTHAERLAEQHLVSRGYQVLARSATTRAGEADLLMRGPEGDLVVVEVKSRTLGEASSLLPEAALTRAKHARLARIAASLRARNPQERVSLLLVAIDLSGAGEARDIRVHRLEG